MLHLELLNTITIPNQTELTISTWSAWLVEMISVTWRMLERNSDCGEANMSLIFNRVERCLQLATRGCDSPYNNRCPEWIYWEGKSVFWGGGEHRSRFADLHQAGKVHKVILKTNSEVSRQTKDFGTVSAKSLFPQDRSFTSFTLNLCCSS